MAIEASSAALIKKNEQAYWATFLGGNLLMW